MYYALNTFMVCLPRTPKSFKFELRDCWKCPQHSLLDQTELKLAKPGFRKPQFSSVGTQMKDMEQIIKVPQNSYGDPMAVQLENTFSGRLDTSPWTTLTIL